MAETVAESEPVVVAVIAMQEEADIDTDTVLSPVSIGVRCTAK